MTELSSPDPSPTRQEPTPDSSSPHGDTSDPSRRSVMGRLAGFAQRHHWTALLSWVVLLVGVTAAAQAIGDDYGNGSDTGLPGTQSQEMADLLEQHAPELAGDAVTVVVHDERGWNGEFDLAALSSRLETIDRVETVTPPDPRMGTVSPDGSTAMIEVALRGERSDAPAGVYEEIVDVADAASSENVTVEVAGDGIRTTQQSEGMGAEGAGLLAALVILVFMFGSLLAASLPLITSLFAVGTTVGLVALASHLFFIPDYTSQLLILVGLGVGIDYALLVFSRYRGELLRGADRASATSRALDTAGRSVLFAGASVIIAMMGLFVLGIAAFEGMVGAVALTVLLTMVTSLTLLPSLLTLFGTRLEASVRKHAAKSGRLPGERWRQWAWLVQRRPWPPLVVAVLALGALAVPSLSMHLGFNDAGNDAEDTTTRAAYELVDEEFGPGANGPLMVVTEGSAGEAEAAYEELTAHPGIVPERVSRPMPIAPEVFVMRADPTTGPQDEATSELVTDLRTDLGETHLVGGATAANVDYSDAIADRFGLFVALVVGVSGLLLMSVFRSVLIAVKAVLLNILSIGAALGAMTLVYQEGWLWGEPGPIEAFVPVFIFAIVFGLSMDYEVFLLSRMREFWVQTRDAQHAVREGLAHTGGVITAAAVVMFAVFGSFALFPDRMLAQAGFAMAVAVLFDALVIRCLVVPAVMRLLGAAAWWLPSWLDRMLPHVYVEGRSPAPTDSDDSTRSPVTTG